MKKIADVDWEKINYYDLFFEGKENAPEHVRKYLVSLGNDPKAYDVVKFMMDQNIKFRKVPGTLKNFVEEHSDFFPQRGNIFDESRKEPGQHNMYRPLQRWVHYLEQMIAEGRRDKSKSLLDLYPRLGIRVKQRDPYGGGDLLLDDIETPEEEKQRRKNSVMGQFQAFKEHEPQRLSELVDFAKIYDSFDDFLKDVRLSHLNHPMLTEDLIRLIFDKKNTEFLSRLSSEFGGKAASRYDVKKIVVGLRYIANSLEDIKLFKEASVIDKIGKKFTN